MMPVYVVSETPTYGARGACRDLEDEDAGGRGEVSTGARSEERSGRGRVTTLRADTVVHQRMVRRERTGALLARYRAVMPTARTAGRSSAS
jgi:hypothetical protein